MAREWIASVVDNAFVGGNYHLITLDFPETFPKAHAGQFMMFSVGQEPTILLRRPMAFMDVEATPSSKRVTVLFAVVGKGTQALSKVRPGAVLRALGPIGNAFSPPSSEDKCLIVGGGIGVAPFLMWAKTHASFENTRMLFGFRNAQQAQVVVHWKTWNPLVTTDEAAQGFVHGNVMKLLPDLWESFKPTKVLVCGPTKMMEAVAEFSLNKSVPCEVSLEAKMGCGIGACLSCVASFAPLPVSPMKPLVCQHGPVFALKSPL